MKETEHLPQARTDGLVINELADEVLVYDLQRDKAHCLNSAAAAVWKQCDGRSTAADIARRLSEPEAVATGPRAINALGSSPTVREGSALSDDHRLKSVPLTEQVVWFALDQLSRDHLLEGQLSRPASVPRMSRREAIRRVGIGAAVALPIVVSITAPTPAQAGTCKAKGQSCGTGSQCCSKACIAGTCA